MGLTDKSPFGKTDSFQGFLGISGMNGGEPSKDSDEKRFNETLKRMLKTPPNSHEKSKNEKPGTKPGKTRDSKQDS